MQTLRALSTGLLLVAIAGTLPSLASAQSPADTLRAAAKPIALKDVPDDFRAVTLGGNGELTPWLLFGFSGGSENPPGQRTVLRALSALWVQPDEFADLLDGKRPRIRGFKLDMAALAGMATGGQTPVPTFTESWLEAGRIVTWSPAPDLTKEALTRAFAGAGRESGTVIESTTAEATATAEGATPASAADKTQRMSDLKQIALAVLLYMGDNDERFPDAQASSYLQTKVAAYTKSMSVFANSPTTGRVLYNTHLSGLSANAIAQPGETILLWEERAWSDGLRAVAYVDGHVKRLNEDAWAKAWKAELARRAGK